MEAYIKAKEKRASVRKKSGNDTANKAALLNSEYLGVHHLSLT